MILTDDQGAWSMGCAGNADVRTPHMDALAARGVRFENFFCASPVCSPARASLITGRMPSRHGVHDWLSRGYVDEENLSASMRAAFEDPNAPRRYDWPRSQLMGDRAIRFLEGQRAYTDMLSEMGYTCALSGKWHLGDSGTPQHGFTWWRPIAMGGDNYFTPTVQMPDGRFDMLEGTYVTTRITNNAIDFLRQRGAEDQPFYLSVHYTAPHAPFDRDNHPADCFAPFEESLFPSLPEDPPHPDSPFAGMDAAAWRGHRTEAMRGYCAALYGVDREIGRILQALETLGLADNTLILFCGDNGMSVGHHGIIGKGNATFPMNMYEESVKVPMIVSWPGHVAEGAVAQGLYSHVDVFPTLAALLGAEVPEGLPGISFLSALNGMDCDGRDHVFICDEYGPVRMVRTREWKYVHRYPYGPHELYHLAEDPREARNLVANTILKGVLEELRGRLEAFFLAHADPRV